MHCPVSVDIELQFLNFKDGRLTVELRRHHFMCMRIARGQVRFLVYGRSTVLRLAVCLRKNHEKGCQ